jgi:AraC-like DNA-binding protein
MSRFCFRAELLEVPNLTFDEMTCRYWNDACDIDQTALGAVQPVTIWKILQGRTHLGTLQSLADELNISLRTLHRQFAAEGIDYSEMVDSRRLGTAKSLLLRGSTVEQTAEALRFSDARSFRRAFKRWTGVSPTDYLRDSKFRGGSI